MGDNPWMHQWSSVSLWLVCSSQSWNLHLNHSVLLHMSWWRLRQHGYHVHYVVFAELVMSSYATLRASALILYGVVNTLTYRLYLTLCETQVSWMRFLLQLSPSLNNRRFFMVTTCNRPLTNQVIRVILCTWLREEPLGEPLNQHLDNLIHHVTDKSVSVLDGSSQLH